MSEKQPLLKGDSSTPREPFLVNSLNRSAEDLNEQSLNDLAQHARYRYYTKLYPRQELIIPDHVLPPYLFLPILPSIGYKQSSLITIFAIWNTMMGTSLLSLPWAIGQSGFVLGMALIITMGLICFYTCYLILKSANYMDKSKFEALEFTDVCEHYLGKSGKICSIVSSLVALLGSTTVYLVLLSNFLFSVGQFIHDQSNSVPGNVTSLANYSGSSLSEVLCAADESPKHTKPTSLTSSGSDAFYNIWQQDLTVPFYLLVVLLPLSSFKSPTFFTKFNALGTLSVFYIIVFVCVKSATWGPNLHFEDSLTEERTPLYNLQFPALTGTLGLAFYIHNAILSIMRNQEKPQNNTRDLTIAYSLATGTYFSIGFIFYSCFPLAKLCIQQVLLDNFASGDVMTFCAHVCLLFQMITVFPLLMYILRVQIFTLLFRNVYPSLIHVVVLNFLVIGLGIVFAIFYPHVGHIIRYVGSTSGLAYIFALPCIVYMLIEKRKNSLTWPKLIIHCGLLFLGFLNFASQFMIK
ncbi:neutral amino acid transporter 9-like [Rhopilema esculentum]|uniref:neutral amino acid transporter 9-like n=1 Tax=Rhopilema esculentum TaxID=499914 RepID=UPI0031D1A3C8|eukprot:gene4151-20333_t